MTRLGPFSLLLGKLGGALVPVFLLLVVQLPLVFLAIPLGGVAVRQLLHAGAALAGHLVLLAGIGGLCSTISRTPRQAGLLVVLFLLGVFLLPRIVLELVQTGWPGAAGQQGFIGALDAVGGFLTGCSIWARLAEITSLGYQGGLLERQLLTNLAGGVLAFLLAVAIFERAPHDAEAPARRGPRRPVRLRGPASAGVPSARPTRRYPFLPHVLKDFHHIAGGWKGLLAKTVVYTMLVVLAAGSSGASPRTFLTDLGSSMMTIASIGVLVEGTFLLSTVFAREWRWRTWPLLCLLPTSLKWLAYQKLFGTLLSLLPVMTLGLTGAILVGALDLSFLIQGDLLFLFIHTGGVLVFAAHLLVLTSLYMRRGSIVVAACIFVGTHFVSAMLFLWPPLFFLLLLTYWVLAVVLHVKIFHRLSDLAGE